jgi:molecular chaperone GrpE
MSHKKENNSDASDNVGHDDKPDRGIRIEINDDDRAEPFEGRETELDEDGKIEVEDGLLNQPEAEPSSAEDEEAAASESDRYLRLAAEFDNYRKRTAREFGEIVRTANMRLLRSLVEIIDNFERAMNHENGEDDGDAYRKGVELIYNQLTELLQKEQVTVIESIGKPFDPALHEAMMQVDSNEYGEGIVCQEIQKGYKIDDKVLRHARVVVSRGSSDNKKENK